MTESIRDWIDNFAAIGRRVSNLETGVHPIAADAGYAFSIPPTVFPPGSGSVVGVQHPYNPTSPNYPRYQKRSGIGSLSGQWSWSANAGVLTGYYGTLPPSMMPTQAMTFLVASAGVVGSYYEYIGICYVASDGRVYIRRNGRTDLNMTYNGNFEGVVFPVI
jgi:hypothetical protein